MKYFYLSLVSSSNILLLKVRTDPSPDASPQHMVSVSSNANVNIQAIVNNKLELFFIVPGQQGRDKCVVKLRKRAQKRKFG